MKDALACGRAADPGGVLRHREMLESLSGRSAAGLSELESGVLNRFLEGKSYLEISGELGLPVKTVDNAVQRARRKVARTLCSLN